MPLIHVSAEGVVDAAPEQVYSYIADYREHHPHFLPPAFSELKIDAGGVGAGTIFNLRMSTGGRTREYLMEVAEPEPGRVLTESDRNSSLVTSFTVEPEGPSSSRVRIETGWDGAGGIGGFFERKFAPKVLQRLYADELQRLNAYAREQA